MIRLINLMNVAFHLLRGCGELLSTVQSVYEVLCFHPHVIEAIHGIETALKVILQAQIQGVIDSKDNSANQVYIDSVSAVCQTFLPFQTFMNKSVLCIAIFLSLRRYYKLHLRQDIVESDGS